jgi:hypothetical protein
MVLSRSFSAASFISIGRSTKRTLFHRSMSHHPSALRNREPIADKMAELLDRTRPLWALEIASGTGAHVELLAARFPHVQWQPSEYLPDNQQAFRTEEQLAALGKIGERHDMTELEVRRSIVSTIRFRDVTTYACQCCASLPPH